MKIKVGYVTPTMPLSANPSCVDWRSKATQ